MEYYTPEKDWQDKEGAEANLQLRWEDPGGLDNDTTVKTYSGAE